MAYLAGYVTPQDYGAAGNGSTDDTAAVQAAINAVAASGGGTLLLPAGTYKISSALSFTSAVSLLGLGPGISVINQTSTSANGLTYNPATTLSYVSIAGLSVTGPGSGTGVGILLEANSGAASVVSAALENVAVAGFGSHNIEVVNGVGCSLDTVNSASSGGHCFFLSGGTGNVLDNCFANGGVSTQQGFQLTSVSYTTLNGCRALGCGGGYQITGGSANSIAGCGADAIVAANGQDGSGFKINGGSVHSLSSCYSNVNKAKAFYVTGSATAAMITNVQEANPSGATASIQVDAGSTAALAGNSIVTATSLASSTTGSMIAGPATGYGIDSALAQTAPVWATSASAAPVSGTLYVQAVFLPAGVNVKKIGFCTGTTAASGPTHWWVALLDNAYKQQAHSADQLTGALAASTWQNLTLATPYTTTYSGTYYLALMVATSTTQPTVLQASSAPAAQFLGGTGAPTPMPGGASTTVLTAPGTDGTTTYAAPTVASAPFFLYCS